MDVLEGRVMPSTLTVMNNADNGAGSLRAAITQAASGDTIVFKNSVNNIVLTSGELVISKSLDIEGPGANKLTISGNDASRVFHVLGGSTLTLANLSVAHGLASGALDQSITGLYSGTGTGAGGGGGILNEAGATLNLNHDTVRDNQAVHGPSPLAFTVLGGGLLNLGTASVQGCLFSNNQVEGGNGLDNIGGSAGGGIDNFGGPTGGATITVANSTLANNTAAAAGGAVIFGIGGALDSNAGLNGFDPTQAKPSTATLTNCRIVNNLATGGPNAIADGGGLDNEGDGAVMTLVGCTVSGNRSVGGGGGDGVTTGDSEGVGGGIETGGGTLNVIGCTITYNLAQGGPNAILSDADPLAGGAYGGGIENNFANTLNISNSLIAFNTAQGGATAQGPGGDAVGGGISNSPGATAMNMVNCTVLDNNAIAGPGGPGVNSLLVNTQAGFAFGGGVDTSRGSTASISGSCIIGNSAIGSAGGAGNNGGNGYGGGLAVGFGILAGFGPDGSQLSVTNSSVVANVAQGGSGGAGANGGDGQGGGIYVSPTCSANVVHTSIVFNGALGGPNGTGGTNGDGVGGGVYNGGMFSDDLLSLLAFNFASTSHNNQYP
jgi:hypothetical protein